METSPPLMESAPGPETVIDGRRYCYFGGTNYLGLAGRPEVIEAACAAVRRYGIHTATSRKGFGYNPITLEVERRAAEFFGLEEAFYFSSGYTSNHIVVAALAEAADVILIDEAAHYCLAEAARLAGKPVVAFPHRDPAGLAKCLRQQLRARQRPLVLSDGVFSGSGALAPVTDYVELLKEYAPAALHLDDAHGWGVLGENGRGVLEHFGFWGPHVNVVASTMAVSLTVGGTLAKAFGGFGGLVPGSREFLRHIRAASHYFDGASAPSSADAGATAKALEIVRREPELRQQLRANSARLRVGLQRLGVAVPDGPAAHFSVEIGDAALMQGLHQRLKARGFLVPYLAAYSGLGSQGALRFALCAGHTAAMIQGLLASLKLLL